MNFNPFKYIPPVSAVKAFAEYEAKVKNRKPSEPPIGPPLMFLRDGFTGWFNGDMDRIYYEKEMARITQENK